MKTIEVLAARCMADLEAGKIAVAVGSPYYFESIAEAKKYAKRCLTREYQLSAEFSEPLGYSQVIVDGSIHSDFFVLR